MTRNGTPVPETIQIFGCQQQVVCRDRAEVDTYGGQTFRSRSHMVKLAGW